jgi:polysaccharide biosynthesis transport protein
MEPVMNEDIELRWIIDVIRRRWWLIAALAVLATVVAFIVSRVLLPVYVAKATLMISPAKSTSTSLSSDLTASERLALTYSQMLKDRTVLAQVVTQPGIKRSIGTVADEIQTEPITGTQLIRLTVSDSDPEQAALIANTLAEVFKGRVETLSNTRYSATLLNAQERIDSLQTTVGELEGKVDTLQLQKVQKDVLLSNKQDTLLTFRNDYQALQQNQQQIKLTASQISGNVFIFEPVMKSPGSTTASAVVSVGNFQAVGSNVPSTENVALTYSQMIIRTPLLEKIISDLNLQENPSELAQKITLEPIFGTQLLRLSVTDTDASKSETIANALVKYFVIQLKNLLAAPYADSLANIQTQMDEHSKTIDSLVSEITTLMTETTQLESEIGQQQTALSENRADLRDTQKTLEDLRITAADSADTVVISEPAQSPKKPSQNNAVYIALAGMVGLALGIGTAFVMEFTDTRIRTNLDVQKVIDSPFLGTISRFANKEGDLVIKTQPASDTADDFRILGKRIQELYEQQHVQSFLVTSPTPKVGKSVVVSNLALALGSVDLSVIVVDADLRLPRLHELFQANLENGLIDSLSIGSFNGCLQDTQQPNLKIMTSGGVPPNPAELLASPNLEKLIKELTRRANIVLIDCSPIVTAADASILAEAVDGVLLVLKAGVSESHSTTYAMEVLDRVKAKVAGVVLNAVPERRHTYVRYSRQGKQNR